MEQSLSTKVKNRLYGYFSDMLASLESDDHSEFLRCQLCALVYLDALSDVLFLSPSAWLELHCFFDDILSDAFRDNCDVDSLRLLWAGKSKLFDV